MPEDPRTEAGPQAAAPARMTALAPLSYPNFRLLWTTWLIANVSMWMNDVAAAWLMTSLTRIPHGDVPGSRHGRSRAAARNQATRSSRQSAPAARPPDCVNSKTRFTPICEFLARWMV